MNKKIIGMFVLMLLLTTALPIVSSEDKNVSIQVFDEVYVDDEGDGDVERWAIAMGFAFDGIMEDAYHLRSKWCCSFSAKMILMMISLIGFVLYYHKEWDSDWILCDKPLVIAFY